MVPVADDAGRVLVSPSASSPELSGASGVLLPPFPERRDRGVDDGDLPPRPVVNVQRLALVVETRPSARPWRTRWRKRYGERKWRAG